MKSAPDSDKAPCQLRHFVRVSSKPFVLSACPYLFTPSPFFCLLSVLTLSLRLALRFLRKYFLLSTSFFFFSLSSCYSFRLSSHSLFTNCRSPNISSISSLPLFFFFLFNSLCLPLRLLLKHFLLVTAFSLLLFQIFL